MTNSDTTSASTKMATSTSTTTSRTTTTSQTTSKSKNTSTRSRGSIIEMDDLKESLALSKKQVGQMEDIQKKYDKQIDDLRSKGRAGGDRMAVMNEIKTVREKQNAEIQSVLSKDQYLQYVELQMNRQGPGRGKSVDKRPGKGTAVVKKKTEAERAADRQDRFTQKMIKALELSKDQTTAFLDLQKKYSDLLIASDQSEAELSRIHVGKEAEMKALLTETQFISYKSMADKQAEREKRIKQRLELSKKKPMDGAVVKSSSNDEMLSKIADELKMDETQTKSFLALNEKYKTEMKKISGDRSAVMKSMEMLKAKKLEEIQTLLSEEQFEKYTKLVSELKSQGR